MQPTTRQISLRAFKNSLDDLRPYLGDKVGTSMEIALKRLQYVEKCMEMFKCDATAHRMLFELIRQTIASPKVEYENDTIGQRLLGCIYYENVPGNLRDCIPSCHNATQQSDVEPCKYRVWEYNEETKSMREVIKNTPNSPHLLLNVTGDLTPLASEIKRNGIDAFRQLGAVEKGGDLILSPVRTVGGLNTNGHLFNISEKPTSVGGGDIRVSKGMIWFIVILILLIIGVALYYTLRRKPT